MKLAAIGLSLAVLALVVSQSIVYASSGNTQAVAQGYSSDSSVQTGMIVSLDTNDSQKVVPLSFNNITKMLGVVVPANNATITIGSTNATHQVFVTNYGTHEVLVSNQNGPISVGDYVTISNIAGVGMKADGNESIVLGQASGNFNGTNNVVGTTVLTGVNGQKTTVSLGMVPVAISIANNPLAEGPKGLPAFLKKITKFATNKSVSALRVYLSMFIVLAGVILAITIIYSGVRNGLISLGRNPLAKKTISGSLIRVALFGIIIFAISLGVAYAVLL